MADFDVQVLMPERTFIVVAEDGMARVPVLGLNADQMGKLVLAVNKAWNAWRPPNVAPELRDFIECISGLDDIKIKEERNEPC